MSRLAGVGEDCISMRFEQGRQAATGGGLPISALLPEIEAWPLRGVLVAGTGFEPVTFRL